MTLLIAIFSVLVLLGCLPMQLARNPKGAKPCSSTKTAAAQQ
jgi:hypothetical protein